MREEFNKAVESLLNRGDGGGDIHEAREEPMNKPPPTNGQELDEHNEAQDHGSTTSVLCGFPLILEFLTYHNLFHRLCGVSSIHSTPQPKQREPCGLLYRHRQLRLRNLSRENRVVNYLDPIGTLFLYQSASDQSSVVKSNSTPSTPQGGGSSGGRVVLLLYMLGLLLGVVVAPAVVVVVGGLGLGDGFAIAWISSAHSPSMALKREVRMSKERELSYEAALVEKDQREDELERILEEMKQRAAYMENALANMWVLVSKLRRSQGAYSEISDSISETRQTERSF
ncbi:hypothetical protein ISN44_As08g006940 [Arabidopsis suecica]|uniref:Uncharacterized protein n=1 Tax=Arabidopsis suecica TaxID=45249 RepID=A0A8T2B202_ARASU|nr:hypothetical protein ISN44_As08g006940 [Arabidopsis suecica]